MFVDDGLDFLRVEDFADLSNKRMTSVRLLKKRKPFLQSPMCSVPHDAVRVAGDVENLYCWPRFDESRGEYTAIHFGHDHVRQKEVNRTVMVLRQAEGFLRRSCR